MMIPAPHIFALVTNSMSSIEDAGVHGTLALLSLSGLLRVIATDWAGLLEELSKRWNEWKKRDL